MAGVQVRGYCREQGVYPSVRGLSGRSWVEVLQYRTNGEYYCNRLYHVNWVSTYKSSKLTRMGGLRRCGRDGLLSAEKSRRPCGRVCLRH